MALAELARAYAVLGLATLSAGPGATPGVQQREAYYDLHSLPSTSDCEVLEADINVTANREVAAGRRRDTSYDLDENDRRSKLN